MRYFTHIKPNAGWKGMEFRELWQYRDLFYFLVWRNIKVRYAQSVLGVGWAVIQPVFSMIIFTVVFGNMAKVDSEGMPYPVFCYAALVPWTYFSNALSQSITSLVGASGMIKKVYFPRLIIPLTSVLDNLVDFGIALCVLFGLMIWYHVVPTLWCVVLPLLILLAMLSATGFGLWMAAAAVRYRDVQHGARFAIQMFMYASPVVYPVHLVPAPYRFLYSLNPMVGVIEGFRAALLGTHPMPWELIIPGAMASLVIALTGAFYFRRMQQIFADII